MTASPPTPSPREDVATISPSDPRFIFAGIKQFGLAPDGSDLRDLVAAFDRLSRDLAAARAERDARDIQIYQRGYDAGALDLAERCVDNDRLRADRDRLAAELVRAREALLSDNDLYYLRSILGHLREFKSVLPDETAFSLGGEAFHDNLHWLDCFIDEHTRKRAAISQPAPQTKGE